MLERLIERAARLASARARARRAALAERIAAAAPTGVQAAESEDGIVLIGRGLRRRLVTDSALRALTEGVR